MTGSRLNKQITRQQILDHALVDLHQALTLPLLKDILPEVRDGLTTGAAYQVWTKQSMFHDDLRKVIAARPWVDEQGVAIPGRIAAAIRFCRPCQIVDRFEELEAAFPDGAAIATYNAIRTIRQAEHPATEDAATEPCCGGCGRECEHCAGLCLACQSYWEEHPPPAISHKAEEV